MAAEVSMLVVWCNEFLWVSLDEAVDCQAHHGSHKCQKYDEAKQIGAASIFVDSVVWDSRTTFDGVVLDIILILLALSLSL